MHVGREQRRDYRVGAPTEWCNAQQDGLAGAGLAHPYSGVEPGSASGLRVMTARTRLGCSRLAWLAARTALYRWTRR